MRDLTARGVGTQVHYVPVHRQPYYADLHGVVDLPGADEYYRRILSLPFFVGMMDEDVDHVVSSLSECLDG